MQKTSIGISVGLFGAALYFLGLVNMIPLIIVAGYALIFEQNEWLKKTAVKAVGIVIFFQVLYSCLGLVSAVPSFISDLVMMFGATFTVPFIGGLISIIRSVLSFIQTLLLLMMGLKALTQGNIKFSYVDDVIDKNM